MLTYTTRTHTHTYTDGKIEFDEWLICLAEKDFDFAGDSASPTKQMSFGSVRITDLDVKALGKGA
jgi:hypothetical protein